MLSAREVNSHFTERGGLPHSMMIRLFGSTALTLTEADTPYISQSQRTSLPDSSLPVLLVNQNRVVTAGSTKAVNTSDPASG